MKLLAEATLSVVSDTMERHPFCRTRDSAARISRNCRAFQLAHSSEPSLRMVGRSSERLRALRFCASSIQAIRKPSSDLMDSGGVILHAPENDDAAAGRLDFIAIQLEPMAEAELAILPSISRLEDCASVRCASRMQTADVPRSA